MLGEVIHQRSEQTVDWEQIIREHGQALHAIAYRVTGSAADAEDVTQQVFLEAIRGDALVGVVNLAGWLRHRTTMRAIDSRRKIGRVSVPIADVAERVSLQPEAVSEQRELAEAVRDLVASLPDRQAAVFALFFFERMNNSDIAQTLSISKGAVAAALHKIRGKIETKVHSIQSGEKK